MWQFREETTINFANTSTTFTPDTIKLAIQVQLWPFYSLSNSLEIVMESKDRDTESSCVTNEKDSSGNLRWLIVVVNGVSLYLSLKFKVKFIIFDILYLWTIFGQSGN